MHYYFNYFYFLQNVCFGKGGLKKEKEAHSGMNWKFC